MLDLNAVVDLSFPFCSAFANLPKFSQACVGRRFNYLMSVGAAFGDNILSTYPIRGLGVFITFQHVRYDVRFVKTNG